MEQWKYFTSILGSLESHRLKSGDFKSIDEDIDRDNLLNNNGTSPHKLVFIFNPLYFSPGQNRKLLRYGDVNFEEERCREAVRLIETTERENETFWFYSQYTGSIPWLSGRFHEHLQYPLRIIVIWPSGDAISIYSRADHFSMSHLPQVDKNRTRHKTPSKITTSFLSLRLGRLQTIFSTVNSHGICITSSTSSPSRRRLDTFTFLHAGPIIYLNNFNDDILLS